MRQYEHIVQNIDINQNTPFTLAFIAEAVAPSELVWPTTRVTGYQEDENEKLFLSNEEVQDEQREKAQRRELKFKRAMTCYYNKKVIPRSFTSRNLVLRNAQMATSEQDK